MADKSSIVDKIRKLLRLARGRGATTGEAAAAAAAAQRLMEAHRLTAAELEHDDDNDERVGEADDALWSGTQVVEWIRWLAGAICRANDCRLLIRWTTDRPPDAVVYRRTYHLTIVGRPSDVAAVRYLFAYLLREIERLDPGDGSSEWSFNFRRGAVQAIARKLETARGAARHGASEHALVHLRDRDAASEALAAQIARNATWHGHIATENEEALWAGRHAGSHIAVDPGAPLAAAPGKLPEAP